MLAALTIVSLIGTIAAEHNHEYAQYVIDDGFRSYENQADLNLLNVESANVDPTKGWKEIKLNFYVQKPWNVALD